MSGADAIRAGRPQGCRPHQRYLLEPGQWRALVVALRDDRALELLSLWAEPGFVHAAFHQPNEGVLLASLAVAERSYPALSPVRAGAVRFERMIRDLWGHNAEAGVDLRPWLDHGRWPVTAPMSPRPVAVTTPPRASTCTLRRWTTSCSAERGFVWMRPHFVVLSGVLRTVY